MLVVDRLFGIYFDEVENHREGFIFANDVADEVLIAFMRIGNIGDVLPRFIVFRLARRREPAALDVPGLA